MGRISYPVHNGLPYISWSGHAILTSLFHHFSSVSFEFLSNSPANLVFFFVVSSFAASSIAEMDVISILSLESLSDGEFSSRPWKKGDKVPLEADLHEFGSKYDSVVGEGSGENVKQEKLETVPKVEKATLSGKRKGKKVLPTRISKCTRKSATATVSLRDEGSSFTGSSSKGKSPICKDPPVKEKVDESPEMDPIVANEKFLEDNFAPSGERLIVDALNTEEVIKKTYCLFAQLGGVLPVVLSRYEACALSVARSDGQVNVMRRRLGDNQKVVTKLKHCIEGFDKEKAEALSSLEEQHMVKIAELTQSLKVCEEAMQNERKKYQALKKNMGVLKSDRKWVIEEGFTHVVKRVVRSGEFRAALGALQKAVFRHGLHVGVQSGYYNSMKNKAISETTYFKPDELATISSESLDVLKAVEPKGFNSGLLIGGGKELSGQTTISYVGKPASVVDFGSVSKSVHRGSSSHSKPMLPPKGKTGSKTKGLSAEDIMMETKGLEELNFELPLSEGGVADSPIGKDGLIGPDGVDVTQKTNDVSAGDDAGKVADDAATNGDIGSLDKKPSDV
ncbi:hypothetical protein E3N88_18731 [Mikania micrantha]|uniref:Uncharacterized protein n=1 Tax=Mikania micrantha TaxID=192012 RepID=A0A5N6NNN3_9ASTR|nr:hypothetical protein E3N88_18731 [Mikania micrantha]